MNLVIKSWSASFFVWLIIFSTACKKSDNVQQVPVNTPETFKIVSTLINGNPGNNVNNITVNPTIKVAFTTPVSESAVAANMTLSENGTTAIALNIAFENGDSMVVLTPQSALKHITKYSFAVSTNLKSVKNTPLNAAATRVFVTTLDSTDKFPLISDDSLLSLIQKQTLRYFFDFAHPVSGLARERNSSGDVVTTGGSGFGIMAIIAGISRNFISRTDGLNQLAKIVDFLTNKVTSYHGAFPHWLNGATGATVPFSDNDDGADLVETSYLMEGLLTARQYFNGASAEETDLRNKINTLWNNVEWDWFRQNGQNVLYWHWSPDKSWIMNVPVRGWNEALITYVLAASSTMHSISDTVYTNGWAQNGTFRNGASYFGYLLPLGPAQGGPLFFEHYSFLGLNPNGLSDVYSDYQVQTTNHTLINYSYCFTNPKNYFGYSDACWGLTASDDPDGYAAHEPNNDNGTITPSAALSSFPYSPGESLKALKFFYYKLGDKIWKEYGFTDAFNLNRPWFADSFLAIDQGPIVVMIENYRSGLLWNLFTSCPEVKAGLLKLGFTAPYL